MSILESFFMGALQGIAEFLPISSSGHLALCKVLFGLQDVPLLFDIMLHVATLAAVIIFFRKEIGDLLAVFFRWITRKAKDDDFVKQKMILAVIFGTISTGVIAILIQKFLPEVPTKIISVGFIITAVLLVVSSILSKKQIEEEGVSNTVSPLKGFLIGIAQGIGTLPGISRSGITISASLMTGTDRKTSGEFSFILSIPAIVGAFILELKDLGDVSNTVGILPLIIGCLTAFVVGLISLKFLMKLINKGKLEYFAFYLIPVGILGLIFL
ncbi:MAG: undecaprenyl-diphosphate phosphatase [Treponemataceae bacterium]|nr:undecaprenyl-diphosphate phosphatase [Treponemataceae bacterium]